MSKVQRFKDTAADLWHRMHGVHKTVRVSAFARAAVGDAIFPRLQHLNKFVEQAKIGRLIARLFASLFDTLRLGHRFSRLLSSEHGKTAFKDIVIGVTAEVLGNKFTDTDKKELEARVDKATSGLKGRKAANAAIMEVEKFVKSKLGDTKEAKEAFKRIEAGIGVRVLRSVWFGKDGAVFDAVSEKLYVKGSSSPIQLTLDPSKPDYQKSVEMLRSHGIKLTDRDYARVVEGKYMAEAIMKFSDKKEAMDYYTQKIQERLAKDEKFRKGYEKLVEEEVMKTYNAGSLYGLFEKLITEYPAFLAGATARMLAHAARRLPVLGDVAATQYEAAAAMTEIGEKITDKVSSSAYMWYSVKGDAMQGAMVQNLIYKTIQQMQQQPQAQQQAPVATP